MIVSRRLLSGFLAIALTMSVLHQVERTEAVLQRPSLVQGLLQQALAIGKRTVDLFFKPGLLMPKNLMASTRKIRFNTMLNRGSRRRNLARKRLMRKRLNALGRRPTTLH